MTDMDERPFVDSAREILANADIPQESKAALWEHYYASKHSSELAKRIENFGAPLQVKRALVIAKRFIDPDYVDASVKRVVDAINRLRQMDPRTLELAEKHPALTKQLVDIATKNE